MERVGVALADATRRRLLLALMREPAFPSDLADRLGLTRGNVSNHLACLRDCGLVHAEPLGRRVRYSLADERLALALEVLTNAAFTPQERGPATAGTADRAPGLPPPGRGLAEPSACTRPPGCCPFDFEGDFQQPVKGEENHPT
ncbi:ArsR/SmtB family transcription factor [Streptomyces sp. NPDC102405]|uniref:ArsR/SmtB family transcription factor n=1 Tax=Streptomyces sp. NPDC102405 TaxID=3366170 RepID=UPI0037F3E7F0